MLYRCVSSTATVTCMQHSVPVMESLFIDQHWKMVLGEKRCQWTKDHDFFIFFEGNGSSKFFFFCLSMFQTLFVSY